MATTHYSISPLEASHDLSGFTCQHKPLELFLKRHALKNSVTNLGRTYVLTEEGRNSVLGYYTLAATGTFRESIPGFESLPRYELMPGLLLGRLAVRLDHMRRGLGRMLVGHAFAQAWAVAKLAGVYILAVDAKDATARAFYLANGFAECNDDPLHLLISLSTIGQLLSPSPPTTHQDN